MKNPDTPMERGIRSYMNPDMDAARLWMPRAVHMLLWGLLDDLRDHEDLDECGRAQELIDRMPCRPPCPDGFDETASLVTGALFCSRLTWDTRPFVHLAELAIGKGGESPVISFDLLCPDGLTPTQLIAAIAVLAFEGTEDSLGEPPEENAAWQHARHLAQNIHMDMSPYPSPTFH